MNGCKRVLATVAIGLGVWSAGWAQSAGQQIAVVKILDPASSKVGVLGSTLSEKQMEDLTRAGLGQGIKTVIGRPKSASEVSALYNKLVREMGVRMIIIPDAGDALLLDTSFEYLREQAMSDKVGLCVLRADLVTKGALCCMVVEEGKLRVLVSQKVSQFIGVKVPTEGSGAVSFQLK